MYNPAVSFQAHRLFCVRAESKSGRDANLSIKWTTMWIC